MMTMKIWMTGVMAGTLALHAQQLQAQDTPPQSESTTHDPVVQAFIDEIDSYSAKDQSRDPAGDLVALTDLKARVAANGQLPLIEQGLLASAFGAAHFYLREYDRALEYYAQASAFFEDGNAPPEEIGGLYNNRAAILGSIGRFEEAEVIHRKALAIRMEMEGGRGEKVASSLFGLGYVYFRQGKIEESLEYFRESTAQQLEFVGPANPQTIMRLASLATVVGRSGREDEALLIARQAQELGLEHLGDEHPTYAIVLNNLGNALIENGLFVEAVPVLRETLRVRQQTIGEEASGTAISLRNLATALKQSGSVAEAEALNGRAIEIYEQTGEVETPYVLAYLYSEAANFAADRGDWETYDRVSGKSLAEAADKLDDANYDRAHLNLYHAVRLAERGRDAQALEVAERWVPVMQAALIETHKDRIWAELLLAKLRQASGTGDFWPVADAAMNRLQAKLSDLSVTDRSLVREAKTHRQASLFYLEMAARADDPDRIFTALQLAGISELSLGQRFASDTAEAVDDAQIARRAVLNLSRKVEETQSRFNAAVEANDTALSNTLGEELRAIEAKHAQAEQALASDYPEFVARYRPQPIDLAVLQGRMHAEDQFVLSVGGAGQSWIASISTADVEVRPVATDAINRAVADIRRAVDNSADFNAFPAAQAHNLFTMIFPDGVTSGGRVLFHGDGALASLPLSLLLTEDHSGDLGEAPWLVREASFQVVGNLSLFGRSPARDNTRSESRVAGIGGAELPAGAASGSVPQALFRSGRPAMDSIAELPALPNAERELQQIAAALPGDQDILLVGPDAAEENFKNTDLSAADIIAFATHGLVAGEIRDLWEPALLLGTESPASGEDGLLGASEIAQLRLNADWVILSACNTSAGDGPGGPIYSGLATAFSQAGARALMVSHWRVRDDAASRLSIDTVRGAAKGASRAEALRKAQIAMIDSTGPGEFAHPALWAPFIIIEN